MSLIFYIPFILQALCMIADEFLYHERRGLPLWEKIGHPLDTLTVLVTYLYLIVGKFNLTVYLSLAAFSCLFITKDEFVHSKNCTPSEHWLHAMLFILHPVSFLSAYHLVINGEVNFIKVQSAVIFCFMLYQSLRWSFPWRRQLI